MNGNHRRKRAREEEEEEEPSSSHQFSHCNNDDAVGVNEADTSIITVTSCASRPESNRSFKRQRAGGIDNGEEEFWSVLKAGTDQKIQGLISENPKWIRRATSNNSTVVDVDDDDDDVTNKKIEKDNEASTDGRDSSKSTPLHMICERSSELSLETVKAMFDCCPEAIRLHDPTGRLPLDVALDANATLQIVAFLCDAFPGALLLLPHKSVSPQSQKRNMTPLERACSKASSKVIELLLDRQPGAAKVVSHLGMATCLHVLCVVGPRDATPELYQRMVDAYPQAVSQTIFTGCFPIDLAIQARRSFDIVKILLESYPETLKNDSTFLNVFHFVAGLNSPFHSSGCGSIRPFLLVLSHACRQQFGVRAWNTFPIQCILRWAFPSDFGDDVSCYGRLRSYYSDNLAEILREALVQDPRRASQKDDDGRLALHLLLDDHGVDDTINHESYKPKWKLNAYLKIIHTLDEHYPKAACVVDPKTGLHPFMMVAVSSFARAPPPSPQSSCPMLATKNNSADDGPERNDDPFEGLALLNDVSNSAASESASSLRAKDNCKTEQPCTYDQPLDVVYAFFRKFPLVPATVTTVS